MVERNNLKEKLNVQDLGDYRNYIIRLIEQIEINTRK